MTLYSESAADQIDHFDDAFVRENVGYGYDVVTMLWHSKENGYFNVLTALSMQSWLE